MVLVNGARQCGKSTLVQLIGTAHTAEWRTLDRAVTRRAAQEAPTGFVDLPKPMVIDGIQRVPEPGSSSYVADLINRDVRQLSEIERTGGMRALIRLLAARSGQLLVASALGNDIRLPHRTVSRYLDLLEEVFLIKWVPAWSRNLSSRAIGTPKVTMVDSGVARESPGHRREPAAPPRRRVRVATGRFRAYGTGPPAHLVR